ncbi:fimbrial protein [Providencia sp. Me31A]|uniref:fimbrial protein n=1 Tax=Providencia sp. Me31A TaxID=3392637 RepID=UPI003D2DBB44
MKKTSIGVASGFFMGISFFFSSSVLAANTVSINIKGNLILNPPCDITSTGGGDSISIDFNDIVIRNIITQAANTSATTAMYQTPLPIKLECDAEDGTAVRIGLQGAAAAFNSEFLATDNPNIGVQFINLGRGTFIPNNTTTRRARVLVGTPFTFYVVPIRNSSVAANAVRTGAFSATATLVADYE